MWYLATEQSPVSDELLCTAPLVLAKVAVKLRTYEAEKSRVLAPFLSHEPKKRAKKRTGYVVLLMINTLKPVGVNQHVKCKVRRFKL